MKTNTKSRFLEFQWGDQNPKKILFRTSNKPAKLILGGNTVHSSGRISKGSDDRDMQFAAEFLKTVEDPTENGNPPHPGISCSKSILGRHFFLESRFFRNPNGALLVDRFQCGDDFQISGNQYRRHCSTSKVSSAKTRLGILSRFPTAVKREPCFCENGGSEGAHSVNSVPPGGGIPCS